MPCAGYCETKQILHGAGLHGQMLRICMILKKILTPEVILTCPGAKYMYMNIIVKQIIGIYLRSHVTIGPLFVCFFCFFFQFYVS